MIAEFMAQPPRSDAADTLYEFEHGAGAPAIRKRPHVVQHPSLVFPIAARTFFQAVH